MQFDRQPVLEGGLLLLRPLTPADVEPLRVVASDPLLWEQHPAKERATPGGFRVWADAALAQGALVALDRSTGDVVGTSRFAVHEELVEVGWTFLARSHGGGRWNGELKRLMLGHAFRSVPLVGFAVHEDNLRSQRAVEKLGAVRVQTTPEGTVLFHLHRDTWASR